MESQEHKECYGTMFPDALHFRDNEPQVGKVFSFELDSTGGMGSVRSARQFSANIDVWDDCLKCQEFEHCYKLCTAKVGLESVNLGPPQFSAHGIDRHGITEFPIQHRGALC
jgi:hypothetical protein